MAYTLHRLAAGSYDLALDDIIVGSVVREVGPSGHGKGWHVELLNDLPAMLKPPPFTQAEHHFPTLEAALAWLSDVTVIETD